MTSWFHFGVASAPQTVSAVSVENKGTKPCSGSLWMDISCINLALVSCLILNSESFDSLFIFAISCFHD